jgi:hypothetical protein
VPKDSPRDRLASASATNGRGDDDTSRIFIDPEIDKKMDINKYSRYCDIVYNHWFRLLGIHSSGSRATLLHNILCPFFCFRISSKGDASSGWRLIMLVPFPGLCYILGY